jgi:hypothetical protein
MRTSKEILLSGLLLALILPASPAHASEKRVMENVVVEQSETVDYVYAAWGDVRVEGEVEGDVSSGFGDIEINGPVGGDVDVGFGDVWIYAPVGGSVDVGHGDVYLEPGATVGDISLGNGRLYRNPEAAVVGAERVGMASGFDDEESPFEDLFSDVIGWSVGTLVLAAATVLLAVVAPRPLKSVARRIEATPGRSLVVGVGSVPAVFVLAVLLGVTVVGIPLLFLLVPAYLVLLFFGLLVAAYFLGSKVVLVTGRHRSGDALAAVVGAVLVSVTSLIPFLGGLVLVVLSLLGTGAAVSVLLARRQRSRAAPRPTYASYEDYLTDRRDG